MGVGPTGTKPLTGLEVSIGKPVVLGVNDSEPTSVFQIYSSSSVSQTVLVEAYSVDQWEEYVSWFMGTSNSGRFLKLGINMD